MFDPSEDEPDEWEPEDPFDDPEDAFADPDDDSLTIPSVGIEDGASEADGEPYTDSMRIPEVTTDETEAPNELLEAFWVLVVVINVALFTLSLGLMFLLFRGDTTTGGWLLAAGLVLSGLAVRRYRRYERTAFDSTAPSESDGRDESETAAVDDPANADDADRESTDEPTHP